MSSELQDQDIEQPGDLPDIPRPLPMGNGRTMTGGTDTTRRSIKSIVFHKDDIDQCIPSLPIDELKEELRKRYGKDVYEAEFRMCVEEADGNGDGLISIPELVHVMEMMRLTKQQNTSLKKVVTLGGVALLFVLLSIFGLVFAVVKLTQEITTGSDDALVSSTTGRIVDTHPSNGGGIYMEMAAFTEPLNITFPGFDVTQECVGQIPVDFIQDNYNKFTTGGSSMTIRHVDYSQEAQPVVFTTIPGDTLSVSGFAVDSNAGLLAAEGTESIRESEVIVDTNGRSRRMAEGTRHLMNIMDGAKTDGGEEQVDKRQRNDAVPETNNVISNGKSNTASFGKGRRRLQQGEDLVTVDDYMEAFADKSIVLTFTKDTSLTEDVYFVCRDAQVIAVN